VIIAAMPNSKLVMDVFIMGVPQKAEARYGS
jgi:hypothetical protein